MIAVRTLTRAAAVIVLLGAGTTAWYACTDAVESVNGPASSPAAAPRQVPDLRAAIKAQQRHTDDLLKIRGVVGTAVALMPDGRPGVEILLEHDGVAGLPVELDGSPVRTHVTGLLMAFSDPTKRARPAPLGFSVGHPLITAGTIGARVRDSIGHVYILSNNHVLANSNGSTIGDPEYQPGPFDGGTAADQIATLSDFQTIAFSSIANNTIDAAIALSTTTVLDNATPTDDAYGLPSAAIYGDADGDGMFDSRNALLGLDVQKYGRTTRLTHGTITGVNATVQICYEVSGFSCTKFARFVDQLIISPGGFSSGGDSGSLIVTDDENKNPVALLFAGSPTETIGNRIDLVLNRFGVRIDGLEPPPPGPFTDVGVTAVSAPPAAPVDATTSVTVAVKNRGNQDVLSSFDVTLRDATDSVTVGTQSVAGLAVGQSATLTFSWTPHTNGVHSLVGSHALTDDRSTNNQDSTFVNVGPPLTDLSVISVSGPASVSQGHSATITVVVGNTGNLSVDTSFAVSLTDVTDSTTIGTQTVSGLAVGASTTLTFIWDVTNATTGTHGLRATQQLADGNSANDQRSTGILVKPPRTDISLTAITGPASVFQGDTAHIGVTVQNVGEQNVTTPFNIVLTDGTAGGATLGTQSVAGLAVGATATVDIPWNTAGATIAGHTLFATQALADDSTQNDARAIGITVKAPVVTTADLAVTALNAGAVTQGSTATVSVTVQNVGQQNVSSLFEVTLMDSTAGVTIGTVTVGGLNAGTAVTLQFSWNTTNAALGNHTLVATHSLTDANAANNRRSLIVAVNPKPTDVAVTSITGPARVNQGDVAHILVSVQNVGQQDVTTSFNVVLTDGSPSAVIATQAVAGLTVGASTTLDFAWNTTDAAVTGHTLFAQQMLPDVNSANNSRAIGIIIQPPVIPTTDVAITAMTAPTAVQQGQSATITATLGNVGNQVVGGFAVTLQDQTAGTTIGTQTVSGLAVGASTIVSFTWNTTGVAAGGHTLVVAHNLSDANAANNQRSATVTVNATVLDIAVSSMTAPSSVTQGTPATIGVTVQNVGQQALATSFDVTLTDQTGGVTIGTQTVAGLAVGASTTLSFSWNTATATVTTHTVVAAHNVTDANAANNQHSAAVSVTPRIVDVALTALTAPASVTQGDTAHVLATVQNVGGQDVTTSFDVVLTDGSVTIGTQTVAGLAPGASVTLDFAWNTASATTVGHTLIARQTLADNNSTNNSRAVAITVNAPSVHVGNLAGSATSNGTSWNASVEITVHDSRHALVAGVLVRGGWGGTNTGECVTNENGTCTITFASIPNTTALVSFAMSGLTCTGYVYRSASNHDPDGSSNGTTVFVRRP